MKNKLFRKFFLISVVFSLLVFFNYYFFGQIPKAVVIRGAKSSIGRSYIFLSNFKNGLVSWFRVENIILENQLLNQENKRLFSANLKMAELKKENELLRKELGVAQKRNWQIEIARIFQLNTSGEFRTALIDKGSNHGVKEGMAVVFEGDILLGVVKEVFSGSSVIFLASDPRIAISAKSQDSRIAARVRGNSGKNLALELITNQENVAIGEVFLTSGLDGLPRQLIIGSVSNISAKEDGLFKKVYLEPAFGKIPPEDVFVLKQAGNDQD